MSKKKPVFEPRQLPDGSWQIKNKVTAGPCTRITALLWGFANFTNYKARKYLYWEIAEVLWNKGRDEPLMERNAFSERIIHELAISKYTAFGGCTSSGKSHVCAGWGIIKFLSAPADTLVFITTTTLKDASQRVWGSVIDLMEPIESVIPCKSRPSLHDYVYISPVTGKIKENRGIFLVAAEKKKTKEAMGRFIGKKAPHIVLLADELGELSPAIMQAGISNLAKGGRISFQASGMSNPDSKFDAFGDWSEPKDGWESVNTKTDTEWVTKYNGKYVRFDAFESPHLNYTDKTYLPTQADIDEAGELLGFESRAFNRMWRAIFFDGGVESGVYSESEIIKAGALKPAPNIKVIGRVAGLDPSFTNGGDRTILQPAEIGYTDQGAMVMRFLKPIHLADDINSSEPRTYQIARKLKDTLANIKIPLRHVCVDATGAGAPFCDVLDGEIDGGGVCTRVSFGSKPSKLRPNPRVRKTADELYRDRVTEMWFVGKEFLRCSQIYNISNDMAKEMTTREFDQRKMGNSLRVKLESKTDYKARTNLPSPDMADAGFLALDSARANLSFFPMELQKSDSGEVVRRRPVRSLKQMDVAGASPNSFLD